MRKIVLVADDGMSPEGTGPAAYVADSPGAVLPQHPRSLEWRYFATKDSSDVLVEDERAELMNALTQGRPYVSLRLIVGKRVPVAQ